MSIPGMSIPGMSLAGGAEPLPTSTANAPAMSPGGGTMSGRATARATRVYATISAAREKIQRRERRANRLPVDRAHHFLVVHDLPWIALIDDLAAVDRIEAVGHPGGVGEVRLRDQDREIHLLDLPHRLDQPRHHHRREALEWLVEQEDRRREHHRPRDGHHLLLAAAEEEAAPLGQLPHFRKHGVDAVVRLRRLRSPAGGLGEQTADLEVLLHRQVGKKAAVLGSVTDAEPRPTVWRQGTDVLSLERDLAGPQREQTDDAVDGSGLARAVASHQDDRFLVPHLQRDLPEDLRPAAIRVDGLQLKHGWARTPRPSPTRCCGSPPECRWRGSRPGA